MVIKLGVSAPQQNFPASQTTQAHAISFVSRSGGKHVNSGCPTESDCIRRRFRSRCLEHSCLYDASPRKPRTTRWPGPERPKSGAAICGTESRRGFAVPAEGQYRGEWSRTTAASPESASTGLVLRLCGCYSSAVHVKMRSMEMGIPRLSHRWYRH